MLYCLVTEFPVLSPHLYFRISLITFIQPLPLILLSWLTALHVFFLGLPLPFEPTVVILHSLFFWYLVAGIDYLCGSDTNVDLWRICLKGCWSGSVFSKSIKQPDHHIVILKCWNHDWDLKKFASQKLSECILVCLFIYLLPLVTCIMYSQDGQEFKTSEGKWSPVLKCLQASHLCWF